MKVPDELRRAGLIKKREFRKSLGTVDFAEARRLLHLESATIDAEIAAAWRKLDPAPVKALSRAEVEYLANTWFHEREQKRKLLLEANDTPACPDENSLEDAQLWEARLSTPDDEECLATVQAEMAKILAENGVSMNPKAPEFWSFFELIRRGMLEQTRRRLKELRQDFSRDEGDALFAQSVAIEQVQRVAPVSLAELIEKHRAEPNRQRLSPKSKLKAGAQERLFKEVLGAEKPVAAISRQDVASLVDVLTRLPANASKLFPGVPLTTVLEVAAEKNLPPMSRLSAQSYFGAFSSLMDFAVSRGYREDNPKGRLSVGREQVAAKDRRHPFSPDQLRLIFSAPLYRGCQDDERGYAKQGTNIIRRGRFWVPLISLFTGMRLQEICQLEVSDIAKLDGVDVVFVRHDDEGIKRIKSAAGQRYVPIHPELKRVGLLEHQDRMKRAGERRLFPELTTAKASGYLSDNFSKWFSNFLASAGATRPRTSFHSFRHTYRDALRDADISLERVRALGGWSSGRTEDAYGSGVKASALAREIEKVRYEALDLSHLYTGKKSEIVVKMP